MDNHVISLFFELLRFCVADIPLKKENWESVDDETLKHLCSLGRRHDLAHLVGYALEQNGLLPAEGAVAQALRKEYMTAVFRCTRMQHEYQTVMDVLEREKIAFLPLKGAVLREHYAEAWMRTSCDIDILLHREDVSRAEQALIKQGFSREKESSYDVSMFSASGVHLELHFALNHPNGRCCAALENVWEDACVKHAETDCFFSMSDARFYLYHIVHMAKHFMGGGCGIRPYMDLWVLNHKICGDRTAREALLKEEGLDCFAAVCERLAEVWFSENPHDELTLRMQEYLLTGGVYGSIDNRVKMLQPQKGGRFRYLSSRVFMPYDRLKYIYPCLQKHRWLMPAMQVRRWCRLLLPGRMRRAVRELNISREVSSEESLTASRFLADIGLSS